jgi:hypothetical protein
MEKKEYHILIIYLEIDSISNHRMIITLIYCGCSAVVAQLVVNNYILNNGIMYILYSLAILNDLWKFDGLYWTWISGSNQPNQKGVYGFKGVPSQSNIPGARTYLISWVDNEGSFWIFGGNGYDNSM